MRPEEGPVNVAEQPTREGESPMIFCRSCEQLVPAGSLYCPHCCGEDGRRGAIKRGAFIGGVFGLLAGGLAAAVWSTIVGPEQATGELVATITLAFAAIGVVSGAIHNRKE
jgi:hypothetical protein